MGGGGVDDRNDIPLWCHSRKKSHLIFVKILSGQNTWIIINSVLELSLLFKYLEARFLGLLTHYMFNPILSTIQLYLWNSVRVMFIGLSFDWQSDHLFCPMLLLNLASKIIKYEFKLTLYICRCNVLDVRASPRHESSPRSMWSPHEWALLTG